MCSVCLVFSFFRLFLLLLYVVLFFYGSLFFLSFFFSFLFPVLKMYDCLLSLQFFSQFWSALCHPRKTSSTLLLFFGFEWDCQVAFSETVIALIKHALTLITISPFCIVRQCLPQSAWAFITLYFTVNAFLTSKYRLIVELFHFLLVGKA